MKAHADDLISIRDMLRFAVSRFTEAGLAFGQGTTGAVDEAAFLILESLHLPVDDINPWADARLTKAEREALLARIEERVSKRKPAAYLTRKAYIQGIPFHVDERVIVPRSFIGELLFSDLFGGEGFTLVPDPSSIGRVLDLCSGSGCLAILAAHVFPNAEVDAVELSPQAAEVARLNIAESGYADRLRLYEGDLFQPVAKERYDLILTNPPYVDAEAMEALPPEFRHEPAMALDGGEDGLDIVRRILAEVPRHLNPGGGLLCEIGRGREILEDDYPELDFFWLDTAESEGEVFWLTADKFGR
ncbi:50S ribosomal protein L3 N(5)-glutamine methyltransferase [Taklimakanibacter lacteus]|uniref:50S ribosomal protein L3 N(5)-glutamine methyltransferase n=1 Tax=Taklimakanibacter lacteus TaxID=2268456 RepID=UPI000E6675D3